MSTDITHIDFLGLSPKAAAFAQTYYDQTGKDLLSTYEVAAVLAIAYPTVHRWLAKGILTSIKVGGVHRFELKDIAEIRAHGTAISTPVGGTGKRRGRPRRVVTPADLGLVINQ